MTSAKLALVFAGVLVAAGCTGDDDRTTTVRMEPPRSGMLSVSEAADGADAAYVTADRLFRAGASEPVELAAAVNTTLIGNLAPPAVAGPDGRLVAYNSWRARRPVVRLRDLDTRKDDALDEGAFSLAWRRDGALAYFKALMPDLSEPRRYLGHVVVRPAPRTTPRRWTAKPGRYVAAAWAGRRLLAYRLTRSWPDVLVLDRPRRVRALAEASALVAVSPDGRRAFVSRYGASPPVVRVLDVASGAELARLRVDAEGVHYVVESGSWVGDTVFAATTSGIAVFRVADETIRVEQVLSGGARFPLGLSEPRAAPGGSTFLAWGELESQPRQAIADTELVECDRVTLRCVRAAKASSAAPPRPVYNPSRP